MKENKDLEIGDLVFNNNIHQTYTCPNYIIALLREIESKLRIVYWNKYQNELDSPFGNTGNEFKNDVFEVQAYNWDDDYEQPYNFKWKDVEISWYKHLGRGTTINKKINHHKAIEMFDECIKSLDNFDKL